MSIGVDENNLGAGQHDSASGRTTTVPRTLSAMEALTLRLLRVAPFLISITAAANAADPSCVLQLPVYDAEGQRIPAKLIAARIDRGSDEQILASRKGFQFVISSDMVRFHEVMLRSQIEVSFQLPNGRVRSHRLVLGTCRQRTSVRFGEKDSGVDVEATLVKGRIVGCKIAGDWWVRAMPMFSDEPNMTSDSYVDASTGHFFIRSAFTGERHIFVIGKDQHPVWTFAFNVTVGGVGEVNNVGTLNLAPRCPK